MANSNSFPVLSIEKNSRPCILRSMATSHASGWVNYGPFLHIIDRFTSISFALFPLQHFYQVTLVLRSIIPSYVWYPVHSTRVLYRILTNRFSKVMDDFSYFFVFFDTNSVSLCELVTLIFSQLSYHVYYKRTSLDVSVLIRLVKVWYGYIDELI